ncbi:hypothetical protein SAMN05421858_3414 [Haladaptatus litoreus]|uniref:Uncharacterized protein n=1 Tax=Haladaptatus litoreus TaxID=553468 RepID=A0A1N7D254_9EURY|nr:FxLYD domain-containing protein [Haladaptatus litoreus]SIR69794.1 hypothetical protein SAMN05421858_3414 [Haladaptatus litoreus]
MQRRQFLQTLGASVLSTSSLGTVGACKHKHRRHRKQTKQHNTAPHTVIRGDSWGVVDTLLGEKDYAITGEVEWTGRFRADVFVTATFYNRRGHVLSSDGIDSLTLGPNEVGGFQIDYLNDGPERVADYQLTTEVFRV